MGLKRFSLAGGLAFLLFVALLACAGCSATGLKEPATPTTATIQSTPTPVAQAPLVTPIISARASSTPIVTANEASPATVAPGPLATPAPTSEAAATSAPTPPALSRSEREAIFEDVWRTVERNYLYQDFHGVDWQAMHDRYLPVALDALTPEAFYRAVADMVSQLKDGHSRFLSPQDARDEDALQSGNTNYVGIGIITTPDTASLMVAFVFPGSPADKAGLARRDRITAVDGVPLRDPRTEDNKLRGPKGSVVRLTVRSPEQQPRVVSIVRDTITGRITPSVTRLAADPSIGLLVVSDLWTDDMGELVDDDLRAMIDDPRPLRGLILDLRGDGGGFRTVLENILGDFVTGNAGTFFNEKGQSPFIIRQGALYESLKDVPLVVLIDKGTASYAELLAAILQADGRARVVGATSAGNTETIYRYDYQDGSLLWLAEESFRLPDGTSLEGRGVVPDVAVAQDWTAYSERDDPDILAALRLLAR